MITNAKELHSMREASTNGCLKAVKDTRSYIGEGFCAQARFAKNCVYFQPIDPTILVENHLPIQTALRLVAKMYGAFNLNMKLK